MRLRMATTRWRCTCHCKAPDLPCKVPPSPDVMAEIFMEYRSSGAIAEMSFRNYLQAIGFVDPSVGIVGMDDPAQFLATPAGPQLLYSPARPVTGEVRVKVLLVDFSDKPGVKPARHYEDLLFSDGVYPTGSLKDYYAEVSLGRVTITGSVHGWLRMPHRYSYYTNGESGTQWKSYPHNSPGLAEDAVEKALSEGVQFEPQLDKFGQGIITALVIVHAGRGAEVMPLALQGSEIWSHKWQLRHSVTVAPDLAATIYLTVPHDCKLGVCAHELGHLAFQWQDFYDPNYDEDGKEWDGSGVWDVMAGGSYNGDGARPAHPAPLHKLQHGWINMTTVSSPGSLTINPYTSTTGHVYKIVSPKFTPKQYLLLENRKRTGFDFNLPGEGLLVWKVDESNEMLEAAGSGLSLVQADGRNDLDNPDDWNKGDAGDPFPGSDNKASVGDTGTTSTSFPGKRSGIQLDNIAITPGGAITLDVVFSPTLLPARKRAARDPAAHKTTGTRGAAKKGQVVKKVRLTRRS